MTTTEVRHPIFARFFDRLAKLMEREIGPLRAEMLSGLSGSVVEVGAGNGMNFRHYPSAVERVTALEPEPYLRAQAQRAAQRVPVRVEVRDAVADALPLEDASVGSAVACLVLCSVPDPARALRELMRVLEPGGELRFIEHVRSSRPRKGRMQLWLDGDGSGIWPHMAGGCHCGRETLKTIDAAGFRLARVRDFSLGLNGLHTNPHVIGLAYKP